MFFYFYRCCFAFFFFWICICSVPFCFSSVIKPYIIYMYIRLKKLFSETELKKTYVFETKNICFLIKIHMFF